MAEPFTWGKGQGCDFLDKTCVKSDKTSRFPDHFCTPLKSDGCTLSYSGVAVCGNVLDIASAELPASYNYFGNNLVVVDQFADNCPYYMGYSNGNCEESHEGSLRSPKEYYGPGSSCFMGDLSGSSQTYPYCLKKTCKDNAVEIQIGDAIVTCTKAGTIPIPGAAKGETINCPDPSSFCQTVERKYCQKGCLGRGNCVNNKCVCRSGYSGDDCSTRASSTLSEGSVEYLKHYTGPSSLISSSEDKPKSKTFLRLMSIVIGVGIIGVTVVVGLTVNKIKKFKDARNARKASKFEYKINNDAMGYAYQNPNLASSPQASVEMGSIQLGVAEYNQPGPQTMTQNMRQEVLRDYFAPPVDQADQSSVDRLAVLRGGKRPKEIQL